MCVSQCLWRCDSGETLRRGEERSRLERTGGGGLGLCAEKEKEWLFRYCLPGAKIGRRVGLLNF
jgi:hypothetical protein